MPNREYATIYSDQHSIYCSNCSGFLGFKSVLENNEFLLLFVIRRAFIHRNINTNDNVVLELNQILPDPSQPSTSTAHVNNSINKLSLQPVVILTDFAKRNLQTNARLTEQVYEVSDDEDDEVFISEDALSTNTITLIDLTENEQMDIEIIENIEPAEMHVSMDNETNPASIETAREIVQAEVHAEMHAESPEESPLGNKLSI